MKHGGLFGYGQRCCAIALLATGTFGAFAQSGSAIDVAASSAENLQTANRLLAAGALDDAIVVLRRLVAANPRDAEVLQVLGTALALAPRQEEALEYLRRAVALRPAFPAGHLTLGMALARFGNLEEARQSYEKVLALDPAHAEAHVQLALVLAVMSLPEQAIEHLTLGLAGQGNSAGAARSYFLRGKAHSQLEHLREAAQDFERAVQLRPDYAKAYVELGVTRVGLQDDKGSLAALKRALELVPDDPEARFHLGSAYLRLGDATHAAEHLRLAARLRPDDRKTLYTLVRALQLLGRTEEAAPLMKELSRSMQEQVLQDPDLVRAGELNNQGVALEKEGKFPEALEKYRAAVAISPRHAEFRKNLALSFCRLELWPEAIVELNAVLAAIPGDVVATRALYIAVEKSKESR